MARSLKWTGVYALAMVCTFALNASAQTEHKGKKETEKPAQPATGGQEGQPNHEEMMKAYMDASQPVEQHKFLAALAGTWTAEGKCYMDPGQPPMTSTGTAERTMIMDGRFCVEKYNGEMMGSPFEGMGITGFDRGTNKFTAVWLDNWGTCVMTGTGTCDASGKEFTYNMSYFDPVMKQETNMRNVLRVINDKKHVFEMYGPGPDGKETKMMEITYTRK